MRIALCTPTPKRPHEAYLAALEASVPILDAAGIEHATVYEVGSPYISGAMATLLRKALVWGADVTVFLDHDVSWAPGDLLTLIRTEADVAGGTYRFKLPDLAQEVYMGTVEVGEDERPVVRPSDGAITATRLPSGFLKITRRAVEAFMRAYPQWTVRDAAGVESPDLFHHGAHRGTWFGQDYAFSRNWLEAGGALWLVPNLDLAHHEFDGRVWPGNFHSFMLRQPGGSDDPARRAASP